MPANWRNKNRSQLDLDKQNINQRKKTLPVKLINVVAFAFCVNMWAPEKSNEFRADCDHAPGEEYAIEESLSSTVTFTAARMVLILRI